MNFQLMKLFASGISFEHESMCPIVPTPYPLEPEFRELTSEPFFKWFASTEDGVPGEKELAAAVKAVLRRLEEGRRRRKPFTCILGFSQGCTVADAVFRLSQSLDVALRGAIFFSGRPSSLDPAPDIGKICVVYSNRDILVPASATKSFLHLYSSTVEIVHGEGHVMPALSGAQAEKFASFVLWQQIGASFVE